MTMATENATQIRLYAGLYLRTPRQTRFWGWTSWGWRKLRTLEVERPWAGLAAWLRQAHARLDRNPALLPTVSETAMGPAPAQLVTESDEQPRPRQRRKLQFVCNRRQIGLLIVDDNREM